MVHVAQKSDVTTLIFKENVIPNCLQKQKIQRPETRITA